MTKPVNGLLILRLLFICSIVIGLFGKLFEHRDSHSFKTINLILFISMKIQYEYNFLLFYR